MEDLFEGRGWEGVKSAHDGFGGYREEDACLADVDLAKCNLCFCLAHRIKSGTAAFIV